jgi:hypothetical protein
LAQICQIKKTLYQYEGLLLDLEEEYLIMLPFSKGKTRVISWM